jgi:DNA excision repair protein ERCC-5
MPQTKTAKPKSAAKTNDSPGAAKRRQYRDHDPYRLPEVDMEARIATHTRSAAPDPRLATEEELRTFIEEMRPEDFDVTSEAFRELPTEVQYEIVGDLRLKSRQTSYARLQQMLRAAPTPMDFSKQQIKNLKQRNALTQQLLVTTDSIGTAHISIPVRIASERNKEYVLIKNEGAEGGWVLGIRDEGTREKPIDVDNAVESDSDEEMEEAEMFV